MCDELFFCHMETARPGYSVVLGLSNSLVLACVHLITAEGCIDVVGVLGRCGIGLPCDLGDASITGIRLGGTHALRVSMYHELGGLPCSYLRKPKSPGHPHGTGSAIPTGRLITSHWQCCHWPSNQSRNTNSVFQVREPAWKCT